jgi:hypothetical protein
MSHRWIGALLAAVALPYVFGQPPGVINPLAQDCGFGGSVVCINHYVQSRPWKQNFSYHLRKLTDYRLL